MKEFRPLRNGVSCSAGLTTESPSECVRVCVRPLSQKENALGNPLPNSPASYQNKLVHHLLRVGTVPILPLPKGCFWTHKNDGAWASVGGDGQTKDVLEHGDQDLQASGCHEAPDEGFREVNGNKAKLHEA